MQDFKTSLAADSGLAVGTTVQETDRFATENQFNGVVLGVLAERRSGLWTLELAAKVALGNVGSQVTIGGSTTTTVPVAGAAPDVLVTPAGLLAQSTNSGEYNKDTFTAVPELNVTLGRYLTPRLRATVGYTFLYWSGVARPGDQIDPYLNLSQLSAEGLTGPARPRFDWISSGVWLQGLNIGLDYRF
jgi:hypothetical protein